MSATTSIDAVAELGEFENREAGTDAERRAANHLATLIRARGRRCEVEPTYVHPQWAGVHAIHCLAGVVGSLLASSQPAAGFAVILVAATSMYLDLCGRQYLLRRLLFRRASQNLVSRRAEETKTARVLLCANYDAPQTGAAYNPLPQRLLAYAWAALPFGVGPFRILFWSMALLLPPIGARMAGLDAGWVPLLQLPQTLALIVGTFLLGEIALSPPSPGANDNASGVTGVLEAVESLDADPPEHVEVWALLCGGGATTMEGVRAFLRRHRRELDRSSTFFVFLESIGRGAPRFVTGEGLAVVVPNDRTLVELATALADADDESEKRFGARPLVSPTGGGAVVARSRRYPAISITSREEAEPFPSGRGSSHDSADTVDPEAIARAARFSVELIRLLDLDVGRRGISAASTD